MSEPETKSVFQPGAHIADPAALGLGGFALTTFVLSLVNAGIMDLSAEPAVFGLALAYGGIAQFAAGMWEFAKGNTFGATAFSSFGAFWISFWWLTSGKWDAASETGIASYLLAWGIFTAYMMIASSKTNTVVFTVFILLTITFFLLAFGDYGWGTGWTRAGGWVGLATAIAAWYGSFATVINSTFKREVAPIGPRG